MLGKVYVLLALKVQRVIKMDKELNRIFNKYVDRATYQILSGPSTGEWVSQKIKECVSDILSETHVICSNSDKVWEKAQIQLNYLRNKTASENNWEEIKENQFLKFKRKILERIIGQSFESEDELDQLELKVLNSKANISDIDIHDRYNIYTRYLADRQQLLINELKDKVGGDPNNQKNRIEELHKVFETLEIIKYGPEDKVWRIVNQAWGINRGLE